MQLTARQVGDAAAIAERCIRHHALYNDAPGVSYGFSHQGKSVLLGSWGRADLTTGEPADVDTAYRCASITKTMTATLVMLQYERGKLRLDEPITTYLPWLRSTLRDSGITVRHLLIHGGGVIRDSSAVWEDEDLPSRKALHRELRRRATFDEPSVTFRYSNVAYALLGEILEVVTERQFSKLIERDIVKPLGLTSSAVTLTPRVRRHLATGYYGNRRPGEDYEAARHTEAQSFEAAGGLVSTVPDLLQYQQAHFIGDARLLSDLSKRDMQRTQWRRDEAPDHGLGWMVSTIGGVKVCAHSGGYAGFNTKIAFSPDLSVAAAVLTNTLGPTPYLGIDAIYHSLAGVRRVWETAAQTGHGHTRASLITFVGQYRCRWAELVVARINNSLYLVDPAAQVPLGDRVRLAPRGRSKFVIAEGDDYGHLGEEVSFTKDRSGRAVAMKYGPHEMVRSDI